MGVCGGGAKDGHRAAQTDTQLTASSFGEMLLEDIGLLACWRGR